MGLRNAFEEMATESTLRQLVRIFQEGRFLPYAKTSTDAMRVNVDNQAAATMYLGNTSSTPGSSNIAPWTASAGLLMDDRAEQQDFTLLNFTNSRSRWTIS